MASDNYDPYNPWEWNDNQKVNSKSTHVDKMIQGKMLTATYTISSLDIKHLPENELKEDIKRVLMNKLIEEMKKCEYILFTKTTDIYSLQNRYLARIFVTPHDQVQIIRDINKK